MTAELSRPSTERGLASAWQEEPVEWVLYADTATPAEHVGTRVRVGIRAILETICPLGVAPPLLASFASLDKSRSEILARTRRAELRYRFFSGR